MLLAICYRVPGLCGSGERRGGGREIFEIIHLMRYLPVDRCRGCIPPNHLFSGNTSVRTLNGELQVMNSYEFEPVPPLP